jgi:hypothetical protein
LEGGEVIGVVADYRFQSIRQAIAPLAFYYAPRGGSLTVRVSPDAVASAVAHLEATWEKFEPRSVCVYVPRRDLRAVLRFGGAPDEAARRVLGVGARGGG